MVYMPKIHGDKEGRRDGGRERQKDKNPSVSLSLCLFVFLALWLCVSLVNSSAQSVRKAQPPFRLSPQDKTFLEDLSRRSFRYFVEQSDPKTGLTLDRARVDGSPYGESHRNVASIAATGFGLTALCIAAERGWMGRD